MQEPVPAKMPVEAHVQEQLQVQEQLHVQVLELEQVKMPEQVKIQEPVEAPVPEETAPVNQESVEEEELPELIPVMLQSGPCYWDPESNDLYEFISEEEAGGVVGLIKTIKIKNKVYYLDVNDNTFYEPEDGIIGSCMGQIVERKAVFYTRP